MIGRSPRRLYTSEGSRVAACSARRVKGGRAARTAAARNSVLRSMRTLLSEGILQHQLDLAVIAACTRHSSKRPGAECAPRLSELWRIESIEEFCPKQYLLPLEFRYTERLR